MLNHFTCVQLCTTLRTVACQACMSMGFSRQEYWSGLPFPSPGDLPDQGFKPPSHVSCIGRRVLYHQCHLGSPSLIAVYNILQFNICCCSVLKSYPTLCNPMDCSTPYSSVLHISWRLLKLMSIESVMPSSHFILCCDLVLLPSIFPSIKVFSNVSVLRIRWPKYWSFSFSISPSNENSGLISFRTDWFYPLAVHGTLHSLL